MKTLSRRVSYTEGATPAWLRALTHFLLRQYGTPEGYGIAFYLDAELWGSSWRCHDRGRMVCFDHKRTAGGKTETLVTIRHTRGAA